MEVILGKTSGFCFGVKNAIDGAEKELKNNNKVYCLGEIIHNEEVIKDLENKGLEIINDINDAFDKVIIRAHGVPKEVYEIGKKRNIEILDYTCPFVLKIHNTVVEYAKNNYFIFLLGIKNHPETVGTISFCGNNSYLIETLDDISNALKSFDNSGLENLLIISQTTFSVSLFENIVNNIQSSLSSKVNLVIKNTICNTTSMRQKEAEQLSKNVDLMIIIGGQHSSNTKKLYEISKKHCKNVLLIQTEKNLKQEYFHGIGKVGIMAGASTPQSIIEDVVNFCKN